MKQHKKSPVERLREKLVPFEYVKDLSKLPHKPFDGNEFLRLARKVRKTYSSEELIRLESTLGVPE